MIRSATRPALTRPQTRHDEASGGPAGRLTGSTRTLLLLRHAKSSWSNEALGDHERPLSSRGRKAARHMGDYIEARGLEPSLVLCSTSLRTRETLARALPHLAGELELRIEADLYLAPAERLLERLRRIEEGVATALVIAHNPGLEDLAHSLAGSGPAGDREALARSFPTAALAELGFSGPWSELAPGAAALRSFTTPRRYNDGP